MWGPSHSGWRKPTGQWSGNALKVLLLLQKCTGLENVTTICTGERRFSLPDLMVGFDFEDKTVTPPASILMPGGNWKFGLKDLAISSGKTGISTKYPLEGKDYFHANNCDTHNAYHQVRWLSCNLFIQQWIICLVGNDKGSKAAGKRSSQQGYRRSKRIFLSIIITIPDTFLDLDHSAGTTAISGIPNTLG